MIQNQLKAKGGDFHEAGRRRAAEEVATAKAATHELGEASAAKRLLPQFLDRCTETCTSQDMCCRCVGLKRDCCSYQSAIDSLQFVANGIASDVNVS
jgi:hypothetical protein